MSEHFRSVLNRNTFGVPRADAEILLAHTLKKSRSFIIAHPEHPISKNYERRFLKLLERRSKCEPIAFLTREKEFYGRVFRVNRHTLIPRPETELLVECALKHLDDIEKNFETRKKFFSRVKKTETKKFPPVLIIDIGTGSGNIIVTLAKELEAKKISGIASFIAVDISEGALRIARKNAIAESAKKDIRFLRSDLLRNVPRTLLRSAQYIIIVANLPYLSETRYRNTPRDIRNYEPKSALESGRNGLQHYQRLLREIYDRFDTIGGGIPQCSLLFEIDPEQTRPLAEMIRNHFPNSSTVFSKDLSGKYRVADIEIKTEYTA